MGIYKIVCDGKTARRSVMRSRKRSPKQSSKKSKRSPKRSPKKSKRSPKRSPKKSKRMRGGSLNAGYYLYASQEELQKAMNSFSAEEKAALSKLPKSIQDMAIQSQAAALYGPAAGRQAALDKLSTLVSQAQSTVYNNTVGAYNAYRTNRSSNQTLNGVRVFQNTICSKSLEDARKTMGGITGSLTADQQAFLDKLQSYLKNDEYVCKKSTNELIEELQRLTQQQVQQVMAQMPTNDAAPQLNPFYSPAAAPRIPDMVESMV